MEKLYFEKDKTFIESYIYGSKLNPVLLFIHGAGASSLQFKNQLEYFSKDYFVISMGIHGHSEVFRNRLYDSEDFKLSKLSDDVLFVLGELGVKRVHLVGNSAGGLIGFEIIKRFPEYVLSIVTFGTCPVLNYPDWMTRMISKIDEKMLNRRPEKYLRFAAEHSTKKISTADEIVNFMMKSRHAAHLIRGNIGNYNYSELIKSIKVPYLIIKGKYDKSINKELNKVNSVIKSNRMISVVEFNESGHFANLDEPDLFNNTVSDFLKGLN